MSTEGVHRVTYSMLSMRVSISIFKNAAEDYSSRCVAALLFWRGDPVCSFQDLTIAVCSYVPMTVSENQD